MNKNGTSQSSCYTILFNSDADLSTIIKYILKTVKDERIVFITTHGLFENEKEFLTLNLIKFKLDFYHFGDFNDDSLLYNLDQEAYNISKSTIDFHSLYINTFKANLLYTKNKFIFDTISRQFQIREFTTFCTRYEPYNLGISYSFWKTQGKIIPLFNLKNQCSLYIKSKINYGLLGKMIYLFKAFFASISLTSFQLAEGDNIQWFFRSVYRIKLKSPNTKKLFKIPLFIPFKNKKKFAVGLHESGKLLNLHPFFKKENVIIIGDAYRPSNYPPFLFAYLFRGTHYVYKYDLDKVFFSKNGISVIDKRPKILNEEKLFLDTSLAHKKEIETIVLSINHAGDWTALLNRSDTDILIESFVRIARSFNTLNFIIRLHPTMDAKTAEGINSKRRIIEYVKHLKLKNLSVSNLSMEEDWNRGDLFISEYSLSVIDAINKGKLGIFYNLTNRRSFVDDLLNRGIVYCDSENELIQKIKTIIDP